VATNRVGADFVVLLRGDFGIGVCPSQRSPDYRQLAHHRGRTAPLTDTSKDTSAFFIALQGPAISLRGWADFHWFNAFGHDP